MTNADKVETVKKILGAAWECVPTENEAANEAAYWKGILVALEVVLE